MIDQYTHQFRGKQLAIAYGRAAAEREMRDLVPKRVRRWNTELATSSIAMKVQDDWLNGVRGIISKHILDAYMENLRITGRLLERGDAGASYENIRIQHEHFKARIGLREG